MEEIKRLKLIIITKIYKHQTKKNIIIRERELGITEELLDFENADSIVKKILSTDFHITNCQDGLWFIGINHKHIGDLLLSYNKIEFDLTCDLQYLPKILKLFKPYGYIVNTYGCKYNW